MIKLKSIVFERKGSAYGKWYAVIGGSFYYWSSIEKVWRKSRDQWRSAIEYMTACKEGRVMLLTLKGRVIE